MSPDEAARRIVAEALSVDPSTISPLAGVTDIEGWDSIAHVNILLTLQDMAGGAIPPDKVGHLFTVSAIADFIATLPPAGSADR